MKRDGTTVVVPHRSARAALRRLLPALEGFRVLVVDDSDDGIDADVPTLRLGGGQGFARADLGFDESLGTGFAYAHDFAGGFHFRPQHRVNAGEFTEREHRFLD